MTTPTQGQRIAQLEEQLAALLATQNNLQQENTTLAESLNAVLTTQTNLQNENQTLSETVNSLQTATHLAQPEERHARFTTREETPYSTATSHTTKSSEPKVAHPEFFHGQRNKLDTFITQVTMVITLQPSRFPTENSKVLYAGSFLRDTAFLWFQPFVTKDPSPDFFNNFKLFCKELHTMFGDPDQVATAERHLYNLRQKGSASSYIADFTRYATVVDWNDEALAAQFYRGLKDIIKDELAHTTKPKDLKTLQDTAVRIDTRLFERQIERGDRDRSRFIPNGTQSRYQVPYKSTFIKTTVTPNFTARQDSSNPPEHVQMGTTATSPSSFRGRLPPAEYERRKQLNLCLYCGNKDHTVQSCPIAPPSRPRFNKPSQPTSGKD